MVIGTCFVEGANGPLEWVPPRPQAPAYVGDPEAAPVLRDDNIDDKDIDEYLAAELPHYKMEYGVRAICAGESGLFGKNNRLISIQHGVWSPEEAAKRCDGTPECTHWSLVSGGAKDDWFLREPREGLPGQLLLCKGEMVSTVPVYTKGKDALTYMVGVKRSKKLPPRELPSPAANVEDSGPLAAHGYDRQKRKHAGWPVFDKAEVAIERGLVKPSGPWKLLDGSPMWKREHVMLPQRLTDPDLSGRCHEGKFFPSYPVPDHQWPWTRQGTVVGAILGKVPYIGETLEATVNKIADARGLDKNMLGLHNPHEPNEPKKASMNLAALVLPYSGFLALTHRDRVRDVGRYFL